MEFLLWSGGTHSTAVLVEALREGRTVHAHHVRIAAFGMRAEAEAIAVRMLAHRLYIQHPSIFSYSVCAVDFGADSALFLRDDADRNTHRAKALGFVADVIGGRAYTMGRATKVMYGDYKGVFQYPPKERKPQPLPASLAQMVCDCLTPVVTRGVNAPDTWRPCGNCDGCGHANN